MLDWNRGHVLSASSDDDVFDPSLNVKALLLIDVALVASVEVPFAIKGQSTLLWLLQVPHEHIPSFNAYLADAIDVGVENLNVGAWKRFAVLVELNVWEFLVSHGT